MRDHEINRVLDIAYHRNGVGGEGFFVVRFTAEMDDGPHTFVATLFPDFLETEDGEETYVWQFNPRCAVLDIGMLSAGVIAFGENSWRGDRFADALLAAVNEWSALSWQAKSVVPGDAS